MRIGIDNISPGLSTSRNAVGGMRHFMETLVAGLPEAGHEHEFELFTPAWADPFDTPAARRCVVVPDLRAPRNRVARAAYEQLRLPRRIAQRALSVWLGRWALGAGCGSARPAWSSRRRSTRQGPSPSHSG